MKYLLKDAKRLVIKIGSALLVNQQSGTLHHEWLTTLAADIAALKQQGLQIIIVSSGAIALGKRYLQLMKPLQLEEKQAAAAVGQIQLAHAYQEILAKYHLTVAQILLTLNDSENRKQYLNAKNTLETLLQLDVIPIINENDTVATSEIRYGDNDRLAARVAQMVSADTLVLLSDIDGLYSANPHINPTARFIPYVTELTADILAAASNSTTEYGSGGMITKLAAAKIALSSGTKMVIAAGKPFHPLSRIDQTEKNTWFIPKTTPLNARKNWIAHHLKPKGTLTIDSGAYSALQQGKSLLSVGVTDMTGEFHKGDAICILNNKQQEVARGLINYAAADAKKIIGKKSTDYETVLGYRGSEEIIHRNDLVIL